MPTMRNHLSGLGTERLSIDLYQPAESRTWIEKGDSQKSFMEATRPMNAHSTVSR
jgi:hypothetical protein